MITEGKYARDQTIHIVTSWSDQIHGQRFFAAKKNPKAPNMTKWRRATLASTGFNAKGFPLAWNLDIEFCTLWKKRTNSTK